MLVGESQQRAFWFLIASAKQFQLHQPPIAEGHVAVQCMIISLLARLAPHSRDVTNQ
jgi:hypothetical protein